MTDTDMRNDLPSRWLRVGGWSLIVGGFLGVITRYIWFLAHGPTEFDENNLVLEMRTLVATRLQLLPAILTAIGIAVFFNVFHKRLNRTGIYALVAVLIGTVLTLVSLIWHYYLFPHPHSLWGVGWGIFLIGVFPPTTFGWLIFGLSSLR